MNMDRRTVLELGLLALAGQMLGCQDTKTSHGIERITGTRQDLKSAQSVGRLWLDSLGSKKPTAAELLTALTEGAPTTSEALTAWLQVRHHTDLEEGRLTDALGWVLSETEARIYALAALA